MSKMEALMCGGRQTDEPETSLVSMACERRPVGRRTLAQTDRHMEKQVLVEIIAMFLDLGVCGTLGEAVSVT